MLIGSSAGTAKVTVDALRARGIPAGLVKIRVFRPFPAEELAQTLKNVKALAILDKAESFSAQGCLLYTSRQCVYSPTLQELRQKEKEIQKQIDEGIDYEAGQITVIELLEKYISLKKGVRYNTQVGYRFVLNLVRKEDFGYRKISTVKVSDAKQWFAKLQKDGRGFSTISSVRAVSYTHLYLILL